MKTMWLAPPVSSAFQLGDVDARDGAGRSTTTRRRPSCRNRPGRSSTSMMHGGWFCGSGADGATRRHLARAGAAVVAEAVDVDRVVVESRVDLEGDGLPVLTLMSVANPWMVGSPAPPRPTRSPGCRSEHFPQRLDSLPRWMKRATGPERLMMMMAASAAMMKRADDCSTPGERHASPCVRHL